LTLINALSFPVICRCDLCEPGCNCALVPVVVDVDELTAVEVARFTATGTAAQRAEIASYFAPVKEIRIMKTTVAPKPHTTESNCTFAASCGCSECAAARIPSSCPEGCPCLVCLVDGLSANRAPRRAA
jgi:hypothetical protein